MTWWNRDDFVGWNGADFVSELFRDRSFMGVETVLAGDGLIPSTVQPHTGKGKYVYAVLAKVPINRVTGASRVLYIGQGNASRVCNLLNNTHSASRALRHIGAMNARTVAVVWRQLEEDERLSTNSCLVEAFLLHQVAEKHGELPPANLRWEGYFVGALLKAMMQHVHGARALKGLRAYDWPATLKEERPAGLDNQSTWCDYGDLTLGWLWPEEWGNKSKLGQPGTLVLACRERGGTDWSIVRKGSLVLCGLGGFEDVRKIDAQWRIVNQCGESLLGSSPKEKLANWLSRIDGELAAG